MFGIEERPAGMSQQGMQQIMMVQVIFMRQTLGPNAHRRNTDVIPM
jgi:hypothetical protein